MIFYHKFNQCLTICEIKFLAMLSKKTEESSYRTKMAKLFFLKVLFNNMPIHAMPNPYAFVNVKESLQPTGTSVSVH